jgi:hypothetical protein
LRARQSAPLIAHWLRCSPSADFAYEAGVPAYRFYTLPRDHAAAPREATFFDDRTALLWGFRSAGLTGVEVWEGSRFVGRIHQGRISDKIAAERENQIP